MSTGWLPAKQACREHATFISYEQIARTQVVRQIAEDGMLKSTSRAMQHQEPRGVARLDGGLGDQFGRKIVVEIVCV